MFSAKHAAPDRLWFLVRSFHLKDGRVFVLLWSFNFTFANGYVVLLA